MAEAIPGSAAPSAGGGLPQFDPHPWPSTIFWALVVFGVLYLLLSRVFVPRLARTIDAREDRISGDIAEARRARDAAQAEHEAAQAEIGAARVRAQKLAADAKAEAKARAAERRSAEEAQLAAALAAAEARIAQARTEAMGHVRTIAADTAQAMIGRLAGIDAPRDEVERALAQSR